MINVSWDSEDECQVIKIGEDILIRVYNPTNIVVCGSNLSMAISYDRITEERGIEFQAPIKEVNE